MNSIHIALDSFVVNAVPEVFRKFFVFQKFGTCIFYEIHPYCIGFRQDKCPSFSVPEVGGNSKKKIFFFLSPTFPKSVPVFFFGAYLTLVCALLYLTESDYIAR